MSNIPSDFSGLPCRTFHLRSPLSLLKGLYGSGFTPAGLYCSEVSAARTVLRQPDRFPEDGGFALGADCNGLCRLSALPFLHGFGLRRLDSFFRIPLDPCQQCERNCPR